MTNLERVQMELGFDYDVNKIAIYCSEAGLLPNAEYDPNSNSNKKAIYQVVLAILEQLANNPSEMKTYKLENMTIQGFYELLQERINALQRKINLMSDDDNSTDFVYIFKF